VQQLIAQDPRLFENTWYLEKMIIDGVELENPGGTNLVINIFFYNEPDPDFQIYSPSCNQGYSTDSITYSNTEFSLLDNLIFLGDTCGIPVWDEYVDTHAAYYIGIAVPPPYGPFTYSIESVNSYFRLTVENTDGDTAFYNSILLHIPSFEDVEFTLFPNPADTTLFIDTPQEVVQVLIYSVQGQKVMHMNNPSKEIDVSALDPGMYFVQIETSQGKLVKKLIKE
jgi:hypothetical protein